MNKEKKDIKNKDYKSSLREKDLLKVKTNPFKIGLVDSSIYKKEKHKH